MDVVTDEQARGSGVQVKLIDRKRADYKPQTWDRYATLYEGGERMEAAKARFMPRHMRETKEWYSERLQRFSYKNLVGAIVDDYLSSVFQAPLEINLAVPEGAKKRPEPDVFYTNELFRDPTGHGQDGTGDLNDLAKDALCASVVKREAWAILTFPEGLTEPGCTYDSRLAQEKAGDLRATVHLVDPENVINAHWDSRGLAWVVLKYRMAPRDPLRSDPKNETIQWQLIDRKQVRTFEIEVERGTEPKPEDFASEVHAPFAHRLAASCDGVGQVPMVRLLQRDSLWMLDKLASLACAELCKRNALDWYETLTCFPQLKHKGERPLGDAAEEDPGRAAKRGAQYAWEIDPEDELEWLEVGGASLSHLRQRLDDLESDLYKSLVQMAMAQGQQASVIARSGVSKARDNVAKQILCEAYAARVRTFMVAVLEMVSIARGDGPLEWEAAGLDQHDTTDAAIVAEGAVLAQSVQIHSDTFKRELEKRYARALLPGADQSTMDDIEAELDQYEYPDPLDDHSLLLGGPPPGPDKKTTDQDEKKGEKTPPAKE